MDIAKCLQILPRLPTHDLRSVKVTMWSGVKFAKIPSIFEVVMHQRGGSVLFVDLVTPVAVSESEALTTLEAVFGVAEVKQSKKG